MAENTELKNEIELKTTKGEYNQKDVIYGCIYLRLRNSNSSRSIALLIQGIEKCKFQVTVSTSKDGEALYKKGYRCGQREILHKKVQLVDSPGGIPEGTYKYPFQLALPDSIPGVFYQRLQKSQKTVHEALIQYILTAELQDQEFEPLLQDKKPIVVHGSSVGNPISRSIQQAVKSFFCISRGDILLSVRLPNRDFATGSSIDLQIGLQNNSSIDVRSVSIRLIRVVKLISNEDDLKKMISASQIASINQTALIVRTDTAPKGILKVTGGGKIHPERQQEMTEMDDEEDDFQTVKLCPTTKCYTTIDTVFDNFCDGCASQTSTQRIVNIPLTAASEPLQPSCNGKVVKCSYVIDVETNIPWTPPIEISLPVAILPKPNSVWQTQELPAWTELCSNAPVLGDTAVPLNIINSDVYKGLTSPPKT